MMPRGRWKTLRYGFPIARRQSGFIAQPIYLRCNPQDSSIGGILQLSEGSWGVFGVVCLFNNLIDTFEWKSMSGHIALVIGGHSSDEGDRMGNGTDANNDAGGTA